MTPHTDSRTIAEAAAMLGVTNQRVRQLIANGTLRTTTRRIGYRDVAHISLAQLTKRLKDRGAAPSLSEAK
jgi:excisionase family DNA binding protein